MIPLIQVDHITFPWGMREGGSMTALDLALQTWAVREELAANPVQVLKRIRKAGFRFLELGTFGRRAPREFAHLCKESGFTVIGVHESPLTVGDIGELIAEVEGHVSLFHPQFLTVMLEVEDLGDRDVYPRYAQLCCRVGEALKPSGVSLCYHCYQYDLTPLADDPAGQCGLDLLMEQVPSELLSVELDLHFVWKSLLSLDNVLARYGPRCQVVHVEEIDPQGRMLLGNDEIPSRELVGRLGDLSGVKNFVLEHHQRESQRLESVEKSLRHWNSLNLS